MDEEVLAMLYAHWAGWEEQRVGVWVACLSWISRPMRGEGRQSAGPSPNPRPRQDLVEMEVHLVSPIA